MITMYSTRLLLFLDSFFGLFLWNFATSVDGTERRRCHDTSGGCRPDVKLACGSGWSSDDVRVEWRRRLAERVKVGEEFAFKVERLLRSRGSIVVLSEI